MYEMALVSSRRASALRSEEDDPERSRFLDRLTEEKKRPQFTWRDVLSTPMRHQKWLDSADEKP